MLTFSLTLSITLCKADLSSVKCLLLLMIDLHSPIVIPQADRNKRLAATPKSKLTLSLSNKAANYTDGR